MNRIYCLQILLSCVLLLAAGLANAAEIQVAVDRNPVALNDSFQITFTASEEPDGSPDFSPLQQNFEILNQQRSSNSSWVNGQSSRTEQWTISVMAKQAGEVLIPPIAFGADSSKPLKVTVSESQDAPQGSDDLFLDVAATPEQPYVQSQVLYTLKLYRRVHITQASLNEPEIKDAIVEKLGEDSNYTTQINGVDYWVTERKYAIFPQQSGVFTIAPLMLNAEVVNSRQPRFNGFFNRQTTETRRVSSKAITLNVQAVPASFKGAAWLSAESVELKEQWSDAGLQAKVGEPLTRTLTLSAKGTTVGQLPELFGQTVIDGVKAYPDQPVLKEDKQSDGLSAMREEKVALIPSKPGDYTLPALEIIWFNTKTQQLEVARLPAVTVKALASNEASTTPPVLSTEGPIEQKTVSSSPAAGRDVRLWQWLSAALALGWVLTLIRLYRRPAASTKAEQTDKPLPHAATEKNLKRACWENNPLAAKQALLQWGRARFGADSLGSIARHCAVPLSDEIMALSRHLYSGRQQDWSGKDLWQAFTETDTAQSAKSSPGDSLEPLFKL
ncbi:MAG: BatD family protein [Methylococcaceae bacterium]|nr:BatD family protein [Methylococcaceae bacterium]